MLKINLQAQVALSSEINDIVVAISHAKSIVVICGAGISVAAGIPPFHGDGGLYNSSIKGYKAGRLFDITALQTSDSKQAFCQLMAQMASVAAAAKPTHFHELLYTLYSHQRLLRVYTQNIDGLELKSGLSMCSAYGVHDQNSLCVPLHGNLHQLRCDACAQTFLLDAYINSLSRGSLPTCPICQSTRESRMLSDLRDRKIVSYLRPDIVLYGEDHRGADDITDILKQDVRAMDLLLVAGTSIRVDGVKNMVQTCIQSLGRRFGKKKAPFISSIYVNLDMTTSQQSSYPFDTWLKGDCQLFATMVLEAMKKDVGPTKTQVKEDEKVGGREAFNPVMTYVDRRLDLRPLSRYY